MDKEYIWKVHFFKKQPVRGTVMILFGLFLVLVLGVYEKNIYFAVLAFILLFIPNLNFFLPISYRVREDGIMISTPLRVRRYQWIDLKRYKVVKGAVLFNYPLSDRLIRRNRTLFLFDVPSLNEVEELIKEHVK